MTADRRTRRRFLDGRYGQVHVRIAEPAADAGIVPLVCLHLSPGSGRMYARFMEEMSRDRLVLAPDTPGFGESDGPPTPPGIADYTEAIAGVLDAFRVPTVDIMGYHTGSKIAIHLALEQPELVRRLVLVSTPVYTPEELARQKEHLARPLTPVEDGSHLLAGWQDLWAWRGPGQTIEMVQETYAESLRGGSHSWWGHAAAFAYHHAEHLPRVTQPVMILCPDDDLRVPTLRSRDLVPGGRLVELPGWGHGMLDVHTKELASLVRGFLDAPHGVAPGDDQSTSNQGEP